MPNEEKIDIEEFLKKLIYTINKKFEEQSNEISKLENKIKELEKKEKQKIEKSILNVLEGN